MAGFSQTKGINHFESSVNDKIEDHRISSRLGIAGISQQDQKNSTAESLTTSLVLFTSNLPIVVIETTNHASIPDDPKIPAYMGIIYNGENKINSTADAHNHYSGKIGIELRGNSTQSFPKKPYLLETRNSLDGNLNVSLLGLPSENDWILSASYLDHTFARNILAGYLSEKLGHWASRCRLVELVVNNSYQGIYILMEKIKVDKGRLNIAKLTSTDIIEPGISGGYIWEVTGFENNFGESRNLKYPEIEVVTTGQIKYITDFDNNFRNVMRKSTYTDKVNGYNNWINADSFVDELLVQEAMRNSDAYGWSGYFHKDRNGKINAGPVWDFDQSAGNSSYPDDEVYTGWMFGHPLTNNTPFFWKRLFDDPAFSYMVRTRWESYRKNAFKTENLLAVIDSIARLLARPQQREFAQWNVLGKNIWRETKGYDQRTSYQKEIDYLKQFLSLRWEWMDQELAKYSNPNPTGTSTLSANGNEILVYPNPAKDYLWVDLKTNSNHPVTISIFNITGRSIQSNSISNNGSGHYRIDLSELKQPGIYICKIQVGEKELFVGKFMKTN
jgi:hypothetical protein